jgi:hypothetical protein
MLRLLSSSKYRSRKALQTEWTLAPSPSTHLLVESEKQPQEWYSIKWWGCTVFDFLIDECVLSREQAVFPHCDGGREFLQHSPFIAEKRRGKRHAEDASRVLGMNAEPKRNRRAFDNLQDNQRDRQTQLATFSHSQASLLLLLTAYSITDIPPGQHSGTSPSYT